MTIYTLAFSEGADASCDESGRGRLDVAADLMATIGAIDGEALLVLPAGFAVASSQDEREEWAAAMAAASRSAGVAVVFGIDVLDDNRWGREGCPRSFAHASDRGRRLLWGISPTAEPAVPAGRTVTFDAARVAVVFARELLAGNALPAVQDTRPDLIVVLGHGPPTKRWIARHRAVDAVAPTLVVHQEIAVQRRAQLPPLRGWSAHSSGDVVRVVSYRREPDGAGASVVGN